MKRSHQIVVTALLTLVFIVWQAPASLIGVALRQVSQGAWDLAEAEGTLWSGQGVVTGRRDKDTRQVSLPTLGWRLGGVKWSGVQFLVQTHGQPAGHLQIGWNGWQAQLRGLSMEARDLTPLLPGILSKGDWQGLLSFLQVSVQGDLRAARITQLDVEWLNAATGLMPQGALGSFIVKGQSEASGMSFSISSQEGPLVLSGQGRHSAQQGFQFTGELTDNAGLARQFPGFLGDYLQPAGEPNRYTLRVSQLNL